jgi:hypothetical protein
MAEVDENIDAEFEQALRIAELQEQGEDISHLINGNDDILASPEEEELEDVEQEEEPPPDEEEIVEGLDDSLKESMEANLRLKRMLTQEVEKQSSNKRPKLTTEELEDDTAAAKVNALLVRWGFVDSSDVRHVLEGLTIAELDHLIKGNYAPNRRDERKSPAEQLTWYTLQHREALTVPVGGMTADIVTAFKARSKLTSDDEKLLRSLCHKDLRYVWNNYQDGRSICELIEEAMEKEPDDDIAENAVPDAPGVRAMGRFMRLELIDPVADAVVFGDANLTFSLKLAKHRKSLGHVGRVVATTFESLPVLRERYHEIDETIAALEALLCEVWHEVDCTRISVNPKFKGVEGSFGAAYYNFPHAGAVSGFFDSNALVNWRHENLMRLFFRSLRFYVKPGGIVKVASNAKAVGVRFSYIIGGAEENEFEHIETFPFLDWSLHRYYRSYGDKRDSYKRPGEGERYNAQRADADMVYCMQYKPTDKPLPQQEFRAPPSFQTLMLSKDGPFKNAHGAQRERKAKELYERFMSECSGRHVG